MKSKLYVQNGLLGAEKNTTNCSLVYFSGFSKKKTKKNTSALAARLSLKVIPSVHQEYLWVEDTERQRHNMTESIVSQAIIRNLLLNLNPIFPLCDNVGDMFSVLIRL